MVETRTSRRDLYAALTRTAILDAARESFVARGFTATSVDDIAHAAQVSKGAVYHHFPDKQQIFAEVFRALQATLISEIAEAVDDPALGPWDRIRVAVRTCLQRYSGDPTARAVMSQAVGALGEQRARIVEEDQTLPAIRRLVADAAEAGAVKPVSIETATRLALRQICEAAVLIALADDPETAFTEVETVVMAMLGGLRAD